MGPLTDNPVVGVVDNSVELKDTLKGVKFAFEVFKDSNFRKLYQNLNFVDGFEVRLEEMDSNILAKEAAMNYFMPLL